MVGEAVQEGGGHLGALEDLGPLGEGQVGGDGDRGLLVELGGRVEDKLAAVFGKGQVSQFETAARGALPRAASAW